MRMGGEGTQVDVDARVVRPSADADDSDDEVFYDCDPAAAAAAHSSSNRGPYQDNQGSGPHDRGLYQDGTQSGPSQADQGSLGMQPGAAAGGVGHPQQVKQAHHEQAHSNHADQDSEGHAAEGQHGGLPPGPVRTSDG